MERIFRVRQASRRLIVLTIVFILLVVWLGLKVDQYTIFISIVIPIVLWTDQFMSKISVQENGDVWIKRGFTGTVRVYGISQLIYKRKAWAGHQIVLQHTKGYITVDPIDKKGFIDCMKECNPLMEYIEK